MTSAATLPRRIVITGAAGTYGRALIGRIRRDWPTAHVMGVDRVAPPRGLMAADDWCTGDIADAATSDAIRRCNADTVVHLAYAVRPGRNDALMRRVNIEGTRHVLAAAAAGGAERVLVASSATVYGAWPDNPPACDESQPLRPRTDYAYSRDKAAMEAVVAAFASSHPEIAVSVTRPAIICGPGVRNFLTDIFLTMPFMVLPDGADTPLQFVHVEDVAGATLAILAHAGRGAFNVAPEDALTQRELARAMNIPAVRMPFMALDLVSRLWWTLRLPWVATPPGLASYVRYPWVMTSRRLRAECGFECFHSSREAFQTLLEPARATDSRTD